MPKTNDIGLSIAINEPMLKGLKQIAAASYRSVTSIVREMIEKRVEAWEKEQGKPRRAA